MSADLKACVEIKMRGKWRHLRDLSSLLELPQSYEFFAGVSDFDNASKPIVAPRGFPEDASTVTKLLWKEDIGRNRAGATWLTEQEVTMLCKERFKLLFHTIDPIRGMEGVFGYLFNTSWGARFRWPNDPWPKEVTDVRVVFWFNY